jgi:hypothetical protein
MISVDFLYRRVNLDLARLGKSGYTSGEEFNRALSSARVTLYNYYHKLFEETKHISEALAPFVKDLTVSVFPNGLLALPDDYRNRISVAANVAFNTGCKDDPEPDTHYQVFEYLKSHEVDQNLSSPIRKPDFSKRKAYCWLSNESIKIDPILSKVNLRYFREDVDAEWASTFDPDTDEETYDATNSTDLDWPEQEKENFVTLLSLYKGIAVRENALVQFASSQGFVNQNIN